jgi:hypothetical protein
MIYLVIFGLEECIQNFGDETCLVYTTYEYGRKSVPERRHIKFRRREITQKK